MNRNYIILALIFIVLAGGILFLPERENYRQIPPEELMREIIAPTRYVTTDQVSDMIIQRDIRADQAWVIAKRMGYGNLYVMKGGLNEWIRTIIQPAAPDETASAEELELYNSRRGASMYFTGASITAPETDEKKPVTTQRRKKSTVAEGGC